MATAKKVRNKKASASNKNEIAETPSKPTASVAKDIATVTTRTVDIQEAIRERAFQLYQERGGQHGADLEDWVRAEREINERFRGRRTA